MFDASSLFQWLGILAFLVVLANGLLSLWQHLSGRFGRARSGTDLPTVAECDQRHAQMTAQVETMERDIAAAVDALRRELTELRKDISLRNATMHKRIDDVFTVVATVDGKVNILTNPPPYLHKGARRG